MRANAKREEEIARPLPANLEAERSVLGAILLDPMVIDEAMVLTADDFSVEANRKIFTVMQSLRENNEAIDLVTLTEGLMKEQVLEASGGAPYVASLMDGLPKTTNIAYYAKIVRDKALLRRLIYATQLGQELAFESSASAEAVLDRVAQNLLDMAIEAATPESTGKNYKMAAQSFLSSLDEPTTIRVYTNLTELDKTTGGFRAGELVTLTAGTGVGKTLMAQQIRRRACADGLHGMYCSGEMTGEHLVSRELATEAGIEHWKMRRPERLSTDERNALVVVAGNECEKCTILDGELTMQKIRLAARRKKRGSGLSLLVLDYDELIDAPGKDENAQQRYIIRGSKALAIELHIPVIVISQLRKSPDKDEASKPTLERIYGSGAKSKHSSWILFVDREYVRELEGDETVARLCILKARDGRTGQSPLKFNISTLRFEDGVEPIKVDQQGRAAARRRSKQGGAE